MARTVNLDGQDRPSQGPESAPRAAKPRAKRSAAPRQGGTGGGSSAATGAPGPRITGDDAKLHASLTRLYSMIGVGVTGVGNAKGDIGLSTAGVNILATAGDTADAWIELAQQNDRVRQALNGLVAGGAAANLAACHLAIVAPILAARGAIPPQVGAMFLSDEAKQHYMQAAAAQADRNGTPA
jgi:hypothetical protein